VTAEAVIRGRKRVEDALCRPAQFIPRMAQLSATGPASQSLKVVELDHRHGAFERAVVPSSGSRSAKSSRGECLPQGRFKKVILRKWRRPRCPKAAGVLVSS
jgi:hypothetical protein